MKRCIGVCVITVGTTNSAITVAATGANSYAYNFIGVSAANIQVLYTNTSGIIATVPPSSYSVSINAPVTGQIWGVGGTVSPNTPSSFSSGSLTISRILPFTQTAEISNQGNQYPIVTEQALDIQCMESQQVAARTGAYRGVWISGAIYNFGDITQDGVNGAFTNNIYVCSNANTSTIWAADLAAGDWQLVISVATLQPPGSFLPLAGGIVGGNLTVTGTTALATVSASGHTTFEGVTSTGATGTGKLVYATASTLVTPALGTPASGVMTNVTGTAAGLTAGTVTTNANLTGDVTSSGNATTLVNNGFKTQNVFTASRALNTIYHNTTGKTMFVSVVIGDSSGTVTFSVLTDSSTTPATNVGGAIFNTNVASLTVSFAVLSGNYYEITSTGSANFGPWTEWY